MEYVHKAYIVPKGENIQTSAEHKKISVRSGRRIPEEQEENSAITKLSGQIDPYSARNHWEINNFWSTYPSDSKLHNKDELYRYVSDRYGSRVGWDSDHIGDYISVNHPIRTPSTEIVDHLKEYQGSKKTVDMFVRPVTNSEFGIYIRWRTPAKK